MSKKNQDKTVTNLLEHIGKARDILETRDLDLIYKNLFFLQTVVNEIVGQMKKYIRYESHDLDFNYRDLIEMSEEAYEVVKNLQQTFNFDRYFKEFSSGEETGNKFKEFSIKIRERMQIDCDLRDFYKRLAYVAFTIYLWSSTEYKMPFMDQIAAHIKSFI